MDSIHFILLCFLIGGSFAAGRLGRQTGDAYEVGVGIGDVTGLPAGLGLMGYANPSQIGKGIHTRLFARTFIVKSRNESVVFVSVDAGMIDTSIRKRVATRLEEEFGEIYTLKNVLLSATHTHSGPGGYIQYAMYGIASMGFHKENFESIVEGIVDSIRKAHHSLQFGYLSITSGRVERANINRSPYSYKQNPQEEIDLYDDDVDKEMTLIRIDAEDGTELGSFNWFAVHPTSMNNTNRLVSGDNKGFAAMQFEYHKNPGYRPGKGPFVAGFATTNLGDASPNTAGPKCRGGPYQGDDCDEIQSTCGPPGTGDDFVKWCIALGPGRFGDNEESAEIIGGLQFDEAWRLYHQGDFIPVSGPVQHAHQQVDMNEFTFSYTDGSGAVVEGTTCRAALGYSFAAGTIDGPGMFNFTQGDVEGDEFWNRIRNFIKKPTVEQEECHNPKPILLDVGNIHFPYEWVPGIVETQVLRIGHIFILGIPGEFTTMSGRRMRRAVQAKIEELQQPGPGEPKPIVIIAGLSNLYTHYVATYEEYQVQRYEGASTMYGPRTLDAYIHQYKYLAENIVLNTTFAVPSGPNPEDLLSLQISLLKPIVVDLPPHGYSIGQTKVEPLEYYNAGETVSTTFVSGHLRNNGLKDGSYFVVERRRDDRSGWDVIATDADWSTKLLWTRPDGRNGLDSQIEISWKTSKETQIGIYRIRHFGYYKPYQLEPTPYEGSTRTFEIRVGRNRNLYHEQREESSLISLWKRIRNARVF